MLAVQPGGFGTRSFFIPNAGMSVKDAQILKGSGYVTINIKGAHYSSQGNLWQKVFGGNDKVSLSTEVDYISGTSTTTSASIEEVREIKVGHPYYFASGRPVALKLPSECDQISMTFTISAIQNDNLSGALNILNSGELQGTLQLAPPVVQSSLAIANIVKKLLTNTNPQNSLQGPYAGKVSVKTSNDPIRDYCLAQGTLILIYRESANDTYLDQIDPSKLTAEGDGLNYEGSAVQNTYLMFQVSFDEIRGETASAPWFSSFTDAESALDALQTAASDADKQKIWASAYSTYTQAVKLLNSDPSYITSEKKSIAAAHLANMKAIYSGGGGHLNLGLLGDIGTLGLDFTDLKDVDILADSYRKKLEMGNFLLPGGRSFVAAES
jgi:hypothetical protein